jgi:hypothetical protein
MLKMNHHISLKCKFSENAPIGVSRCLEDQTGRHVCCELEAHGCLFRRPTGGVADIRRPYSQNAPRTFIFGHQEGISVQPTCTALTSGRHQQQPHCRIQKVPRVTYFPGAVPQLAKALCYKQKGRGFETRWGNGILLSIYLILTATLGPGAHLLTEMSTRNSRTNISEA